MNFWALTCQTSLYCAVCVIPDIGTSLHSNETVPLYPLWEFPLVLRLPVVGYVGSQTGILAEVIIALSGFLKL